MSYLILELKVLITQAVWEMSCSPFHRTPASVYGSVRLSCGGWEWALELLAPVVPAQLCAVIGTCSTVPVSGHWSTEHHRHLAKIVPWLVWLLELYLSRAAFVVGQASWRRVLLLKNVLWFTFDEGLLLVTDNSERLNISGRSGISRGERKLTWGECRSDNEVVYLSLVSVCSH